MAGFPQCHDRRAGSLQRRRVHAVSAEGATLIRGMAVCLSSRVRRVSAKSRLATETRTLAEKAGVRTPFGHADAALIDEALAALLARHRSAEVDASYKVYDEHPPDEPDAWGDLTSWRRVAGAS